MYYYYNKKGVKLWTPNQLFAHHRARKLGTNKVFFVSEEELLRISEGSI